VFFGREAVRGEIFEQINEVVGNDAALQIQDIIKNATLSRNSVFANILGILILIIGASGVFSEIQDSINYIWGIKAKPKRGFIKFLKNRLTSFSMIGSAGFLLLVSLVINSLMDILNTRLSQRFHHDYIYSFYILNIIFLFLIITLLFTFIFKSLPDGKVVFKDSVVGAGFTAFLFMIGKFIISTYLSTTSVASVYGAAGSIILILIWVYYSAIILYFGAEFTKVYAHTHGDKIVPNDYSVQIIKQKIEIETPAGNRA
jgi:membrane protein